MRYIIRWQKTKSYCDISIIYHESWWGGDTPWNAAIQWAKEFDVEEEYIVEKGKEIPISIEDESGNITYFVVRAVRYVKYIADGCKEEDHLFHRKVKRG
jgi:hypothetical protein